MFVAEKARVKRRRARHCNICALRGCAVLVIADVMFLTWPTAIARVTAYRLYGVDDSIKLLAPALLLAVTRHCWWQGNDPEWDVVAESTDRKTLLVGDAKLRATQRDLAARPIPAFARGREVVRVLFARTSVGLRAGAKGLTVFGIDDVFRA